MDLALATLAAFALTVLMVKIAAVPNTAQSALIVAGAARRVTLAAIAGVACTALQTVALATVAI